MLLFLVFFKVGLLRLLGENVEKKHENAFLCVPNAVIFHFKLLCQEESFVFTRGAGAAPVIVTKADLSKSLEQQPVKLHLRKVSEVAMSLVAALEVGLVSVKETYGSGQIIATSNTTDFGTPNGGE